MIQQNAVQSVHEKNRRWLEEERDKVCIRHIHPNINIFLLHPQNYKESENQLLKSAIKLKNAGQRKFGRETISKTTRF